LIIKEEFMQIITLINQKGRAGKLIPIVKKGGRKK